MKQVKRLYERANIRSLADLEQACRDNRLVTAPGFGPKLQTGNCKPGSAVYHRGKAMVSANIL